MGTMIHDAVMVVVPDYVMDETAALLRKQHGDLFPTSPDIAAFRESMPKEYRGLLVGPVPNIMNGGVWWVFGPDGSKEGWDVSDEADEWRSRFVELFSFAYGDGSSPYDVVHIRWGGDLSGDDEGARIAYANDNAHNPDLRAAYERDIAADA